jgi:hypothetical protein
MRSPVPVGRTDADLCKSRVVGKPEVGQKRGSRRWEPEQRSVTTHFSDAADQFNLAVLLKSVPGEVKWGHRDH